MATTRTADPTPIGSLEAYQRLIATHQEIERKGRSMPYTSVNGHMFSFLSPTGVLGLRLPAEARIAFLERFDTTLMEANGAVMKEYVRVPAELLADTPVLSPYLGMSFDYVTTLKPKASAKG